MSSHKVAAFATLALALCASAHPAQPSDYASDPAAHSAGQVYDTARPTPLACSSWASYTVTYTYAPPITFTETVMTTIVQTPSGQPTQLMGRRGLSLSSDSPASVPMPNTTTVTSTAMHIVTDSTLFLSTVTETATSVVDVTSTVIASIETETDTVTVTSADIATQSATSA